MAVFKCEAQGDTIYFDAPNQNDAVEQFKIAMGDDPQLLAMLAWTEVSELPPGEELFTL